MSDNGGHHSQNITDNERSLNLNSGHDTHITGNVTNVGGDQIQGDKVQGDKVGGNKYEGGTHHHYPLAPLNPAERQNRANLMTNVRQTWIDGFLKQSLYTEVRLELGKTYEPAAVSRTWNLALHQDHADPQPIPPEQPILEIYRQAGSNLLILGEPGSGKTMTLLMLAESLLAEAEADEGQPVPVVLNLSSWALRPSPLQDWLVESLSQQYQLSKEYAADLLIQQRVTLLLDGLDEVAADQRPACARAINAFKAALQMSIVVCCRVADYEALGKKLNLSHAIQLQPLSQTQIEQYLAGYDAGLNALREALPQDETLQELAQTPLMLAVMTLAYQGATPADLAQQGTTSQRRAHIFDRYIDKMFVRRPLQGHYDQKQARHWLSQLAFQLYTHTQSTYYMELMQPTWLPTKKLFNYWRLSVGLTVGLIVALIAGLFVGLNIGLIFELIAGLSVGLFSGLIFGLSSGLSNGLSKEIKLREQMQWQPPPHASLKEVRDFLGLGLFFRLQVRPSDVLVRPNHGVQVTSHATLLQLGLWVLFFGLSLGPILGLFIGLAFIGLTLELSRGLSSGLFIGLVLGLIVSPILGLIFGLTSEVINGGVPVIIRHYALRGLLARENVWPYWSSDKKLVAFLDDMVAHIFLRRVGGGWVFIHRSLLEHFAAKVDVAALGWENWSGTLRDPAELRDGNKTAS